MSLMMGSRQTTSYAYAHTPQARTQDVAHRMSAQFPATELSWPVVIRQEAHALGGTRARHGHS
jgi:hypothetical protein